MTALDQGRPGWAAQLSPDIEAAARFYGGLFGWTFENVAADADPPFLVASLDGRRVASLAAPQDPAVWISAVVVDDVDDAARATVATGGTAAGDPTDIPTLGSFRRLYDPTGAEVHVMEPMTGGETSASGPGSWSRIVLHVADRPVDVDFYAAVFGWEVDRSGTTFIRPDHSGRTLAVVRHGHLDGAGWGPEFEVDDVDATAATTLGLGGDVLVGPTAVEDGRRCAVLADATGAAFTIIGPARQP